MLKELVEQKVETFQLAPKSEKNRDSVCAVSIVRKNVPSR